MRSARRRATGEAQSAEQLIATYSDLLPADLANTLLDLPEERRLEVAEELPDDRLADALEEMPEEDQVEILVGLDDDRAADVLDQMQPDDAADLIAQLPEERGEALLELMEPEEADDVRFLLSYAPDTAGGLMTTEPIIVSADATVAEGLALIRRHELRPRARRRGLRHPAAVRAADRPLPRRRALPADAALPAARAPRHPARHEPRAGAPPTRPRPRSRASSRATTWSPFPVVDENHRLVGVVTIDDVLDYLLPDDWRSTPRRPTWADVPQHAPS